MPSFRLQRGLKLSLMKTSAQTVTKRTDRARHPPLTSRGLWTRIVLRSPWEPGQQQGSKTPNPEIPRKTSKTTPWSRPRILEKNSQNTETTQQFFVSEEFGVGAGGVICELFRWISGLGVLDPCSWPGVSQFLALQRGPVCSRCHGDGESRDL